MLRGQIYWTNLGDGKGSEQKGLRPCIVVQNDIGNRFSPTTIVCPITTQYKSYDTTHLAMSGMKKGSTVMLEQIRVIDKCRIGDFVRMATKAEMKEVDKLLMLTLGIECGTI